MLQDGRFELVRGMPANLVVLAAHVEAPKSPARCTKSTTLPLDGLAENIFVCY